jgi:hypothetical protein
MWSGVCALLLAACASNPQQLPVDVSACRVNEGAQPFAIVARVYSKANRPISHLDMSVAFYQEFRYRAFAAYAKLPRELDPGDNQDVAFQTDYAGRTRLHGQAMRCFVTRIGYLDGTSEAVPNPRF